jgi:hypothetical protein
MMFAQGSRWAVIAGLAVGLSIGFRLLAAWVERRAGDRVREVLRAVRASASE